LDSNDPFAPYDSLSLLIGHTNAGTFCEHHLGFPKRPDPLPTTLPPTSHSLSADIDIEF
jgi:hypothetical protein